MIATEGLVTLDPEKTKELCTAIFTGAAASKEHAEIVADNLVAAELRGIESHGVSRVFAYCERLRHKKVNATPNIQVVSDNTGALVVDADNGLGAVAGVFAMDKCIERAKVTGMAACAVRNGTHYGIAGYHAMRALPHDMIGMAFTNAPATMAPWGSISPMMGTNPICYAIPAGRNRPIVLDAATSVVARGKINLAEIENVPIPDNWAIDEKGRPTTDPVAALKGSVVPFGTYKGSGIAIVVDIFCALLSGAAFGQHVGTMYGNSTTFQNLGFFFCALNVASFTDPAVFKDRVDQMIEEIKGSKKAEGIEEIFLPGEIEFNNEAYHREHGFKVGPGVISDLETLCQRYGTGIRPADCVLSK